MILNHGISTLELIDDHDFSPFSTDNNFTYNKIYIGDDIQQERFQIVSRIGLLKRNESNNDQIIESAIICESGGATVLSDQSFLIIDEQLILCVCDMVYSLDINSFDLKWKIKADEITCFSIHHFGDGLITHGELQLTKLSYDGKIQWQFGARDILITPDHYKDFWIEDELVIVRDWAGYKYYLNKEGAIVKEVKLNN